MDDQLGPAGDDADDLLRRALIDPEASVAVALRVGGLALTRGADDRLPRPRGPRDDPDLRRPRRRAARASAIGADELLRVPCDLDLGDAGTRERGRGGLRRAGPRAARRAAGGRHRARHLARAAAGAARRRPSASTARWSCRCACPAHRLHADRAGGARQAHHRRRRCAAPGRWPKAARRWGSPAPSRTSRTSIRCPTTPSAAWRTSPSCAAEHARRMAERLDHQEASVAALPRALRRRLP